MIEVIPTAEWRAKHPGAIIGLLEVSGVDNKVTSDNLNDKKRTVEGRLRDKYKGYSRSDFMSAPVFREYERYYKSFEKTYHVQLQVESIVLKNKSLPNVSPLVDSNFIAEVETIVLTAGHDVSKLHSPVTLDVSKDGDSMTQMNGSTKPIRAGDMVMRDAGGICCTIIYGQDNRSPISAETTHALYVCYAPPGVSAEAVESQLKGIEENIKLFSPQAKVEQLQLLKA